MDPKDIDPMISRIVGRLHVSQSNLEVIRYLRSRFTKEFLRDPAKKELRKTAYRHAIAAHAADRRLYESVMRGGI